MRLIDADELIKAIEQSRNNNPHKDCRIKRIHDIEHDHFIKMVSEQPTAFDKEKVIEELTIHKKFADYKTQEFDEAGDVQNMEIQDFVSLALQGAIRIVEKGGLN